MTPETNRFEGFLADVAKLDPSLADATRQIERNWGTGSVRDVELTALVTEMLQNAIHEGLFSLPTMVQGFKTFADDFYERQTDFLRAGEYRARNYADVSRDVYSNDEFMRTVYYPALLFSYLAAPNYRYILRCLDDVLVRWNEQHVARILEVASGHAFLLLFALRQLSAARGVGTDIASTARHFATAIASITGWAHGRFEFAVTNVLTDSSPPLREVFDAAICCELLEHVPQPDRFLHTIHEHLRPGGRLFVSAAVRMESVDHLTLFENTGTIQALLSTTGFEVVREMSVPFVTRRPRDEMHWKKLLDNPQTAATFVADCRAI